MQRDDNRHTESARAGARRIVVNAPKVLAGLAGMSGLAYLAGAIYTRAYFSEFGASWILDEVPMATYFGQSWIPLLLILFLGYLATTNLALFESPGDLTASTRFKRSVAVVTYGPWVRRTSSAPGRPPASNGGRSSLRAVGRPSRSNALNARTSG